jgi:hypothetical protein
MIPPGWGCPRRIGFLFPHPCGRISPLGCPDCENGQIADPYASHPDRGSYQSTYTDYADVGLEEDAVAAMHVFSDSDDSDFTEADGESLIRPADSFEDDFSAS